MSDEHAEELQQIRGLLVLLLQKLGASAKEIAEAMDMSPSTFRNYYKSRGITAAKVEVEN